MSIPRAQGCAHGHGHGHGRTQLGMQIRTLVGVDAKVGHRAVIPRVAGVSHRSLATLESRQDEGAISEGSQPKRLVHLCSQVRV